MFKLSKQAKEGSTLHSIIEHSDAAWMYVSFLFIPFVIFMVVRAAFVAMN